MPKDHWASKRRKNAGQRAIRSGNFDGGSSEASSRNGAGNLIQGVASRPGVVYCFMVCEDCDMLYTTDVGPKRTGSRVTCWGCGGRVILESQHSRRIGVAS